MANLMQTMLGGAAAGVGFALGVGVVLSGSQQMRPLVRRAMKSYLVAAERAREMTAEMGETLEDLYAEARAEHEAESKVASQPQRVPE